MGYKILIGTWGKPDLWKETAYKFDNISNRSTTSLLTLRNAISPDKIIIVALDTICDYEAPKDSSLTYPEIKSACEEKIKDFCRKNISQEPDKIIIAPGSGSFSKMVFSGNMQDYFYVVSEELAELFLEVIRSSLNSKKGAADGDKRLGENVKLAENAGHETIEIHLDLTHGINYMPTLTYPALKELISIVEVLINVVFSVYNSEPYFPDKDLEIHLIERSLKLRPLFPLEFIENKIILLEHYRSNQYCDDTKEEKREIRALSGNLDVGEINTFFSSLMYGLPLALISLLPDPENLRNVISETLDYFYRKIIVNKGTPITVIRKVSFTEHFGTMIKAWFLSSCLNLLGVQRKWEVKLSELKKISENVFKKFPLLKNLIDNEIHSIETKLSGCNLSSWDFLIKLGGVTVGSPDFRNFMAHAGMEKNLTMVRTVDGEAELKYSQDHLGNVKKYAKKAVEIKNI